MESCVQRSPKRRKITDFFQKELPNNEQQKTDITLLFESIHETNPIKPGREWQWTASILGSGYNF